MSYENARPGEASATIGRSNRASGNAGESLSGAYKMFRKDEYNRVLERMKAFDSGYDSHLEMRAKDRAEYYSLKGRREELKKELGLMI